MGDELKTLFDHPEFFFDHPEFFFDPKRTTPIIQKNSDHSPNRRRTERRHRT